MTKDNNCFTERGKKVAESGGDSLCSQNRWVICK